MKPEIPDGQISVPVTQEHIDNGWTRSRQHCPLALALSEMFPEQSWEVGSFHASGGYGHTYKISPHGQKFILCFDNHRTVHPFTARLSRQ